MKGSIKRIALCGLFTSLAMIFSYVEALVPLPIPVMGVKLGLPNVAIICVMLLIGIKEAIIVNVLRVALTAMMFGNMNSFLFSIAGAVLSVITMAVLTRFKLCSRIGVSIAGGVTHNLGQILMAMLIMDTPAIIYYYPVLMISGIVTGIIIGVIANLIIERVKKMCVD